MNLSTDHLVLTPDDVIDLQLHTVLSDGDWTAEALLDYLKAEGFALAAITDHERPDTVATLQTLAHTKHMPLLIAAEMSGLWHGELTDFLCFGFNPANTALMALAQDVLHRQYDNTRQVFDRLVAQGYPLTTQQLDAMLTQPAAAQIDHLVAALKPLHSDRATLGRTLMEAGFAFMTNPPAVIVEAAHQSGAVCILAHPGRDDFPLQYDVALLDELRREAPIDGIEAHYPRHTPEQTAMYLAYAERHDLLVSAGSDSHRPSKAPIKYRAALCRKLLERLGIGFST